MPKGSERETSDSEVDRFDAREVLSPDEAERAAAAFVPLWQLDEAPFEALAKSAVDDLSALAAPVVSAEALVLGSPSPLSAPVNGRAEPHDDVAGSASPSEGAPAAGSRVTLPMVHTQVAHAPPPKRPTEPSLPSIMVGEGAEAAATGEAPAIATADGGPVDPLGVTESMVAVPAPAALREPRTVRPPPRRPISEREIAVYRVPRSRTPLIVGSAVVASALLVLAVYFVSTARSSPDGTTEQPVASPPVATASGVPTLPRPSIPPPPPPADETPTPPARAVANPAPTLVAPPEPAPPPPGPPSRGPTPRTSVAAAPPPAAALPSPPPRPTTPLAPRHPATKNPPTPASPGGIVRDNPF